MAYIDPTDPIVDKMEKQIKTIYRKAEKEIDGKWRKYLDDMQLRILKKQSELNDGLITQEEFETYVRNQWLIAERWESMCDTIAETYTHANERALAYVNDQMPNVYAVNYNQIQWDIAEQEAGYSFNLVDESTVQYLTKNKELLLPKKEVDIPKDMQWNKKQINAQLLQGIIQGESINQIAKRLRNVTDMTTAASIRNARTMATACENKGRIDSMTRAEEQGVVCEKEWLSTSDGRTRDTHIQANHQRVKKDEYFVVGNSLLMYPADPSGEPKEVYNCRCTILTRVVGFKKIDKNSGFLS